MVPIIEVRASSRRVITESLIEEKKFQIESNSKIFFLLDFMNILKAHFTLLLIVCPNTDKYIKKSTYNIDCFEENAREKNIQLWSKGKACYAFYR